MAEQNERPKARPRCGSARRSGIVTPGLALLLVEPGGASLGQVIPCYLRTYLTTPIFDRDAAPLHKLPSSRRCSTVSREQEVATLWLRLGPWRPPGRRVGQSGSSQRYSSPSDLAIHPDRLFVSPTLPLVCVFFGITIRLLVAVLLVSFLAPRGWAQAPLIAAPQLSLAPV